MKQIQQSEESIEEFKKEVSMLINSEINISLNFMEQYLFQIKYVW